jgi:hypothetical protein
VIVRALCLTLALAVGASAQQPPVVAPEPAQVTSAAWVEGDEVLRTCHVSADLTSRAWAADLPPLATRDQVERQGSSSLRVVEAPGGRATAVEVELQAWVTTTRDGRVDEPRPVLSRTRVDEADGELVVSGEGGAARLPAGGLGAADAAGLFDALAQALPEGALEPRDAVDVSPALAERAVGGLLLELGISQVMMGDDAEYPTARLVYLGRSDVDGVACAAFSLELERARADAARTSVVGALWLELATGRPARLDAALEVDERQDDGADGMSVTGHAIVGLTWTSPAAGK